MDHRPHLRSGPSGLALELAELASQAASLAAAILVDGWRELGRSVSTKSSPTDMVSDMDKAAEHLIVERLLNQRPDDGLLGEEGAERDGRSGVRWVIDPLDGTVNYLYGLPDWCVSIAAEADGQYVAGVVIAPVRGETFMATLGGGATRNGKPIHCSTVVDPSLALVATGFSYDKEVRRRQGAIVADLIWQIRDIRRLGAAALDLCHVADSTVDAYFERGTREWDVAAGGLIATEAGARLEWDGDFVSSANPELHQTLEAMGIR